MTMLSLIVVAIVVGFFALIAIRTFPSVNEYYTIRHAIDKIMKDSPSSPSDVRDSFKRTTEVEYSIKSIGPKDLVITKAGEGLRTSFAYNVEIPIVEPVFLLVKYEGSAKSPGATSP